ncbi:MAG: triple tyrosine motif-containing protein, partial [Saprospiraceae bacterium]
NTGQFSFIAPLAITSGRAFVIDPSEGYPKQIISYYPSRPGVEIIEISSDYSIRRQFLLQDNQHAETITPRKIVHEGDSVLWIAELEGLIKYGIGSHQFQYYPVPDILTVESFNDSTLLVSVRDAGVWEFDKRTSGFVYLYAPEPGNQASILTNRVRFISTDKDGGIWMFSYENGISYAYPGKNKFTTTKFIAPEDGTSLTMKSIFEDERGVFCSTENSGLYILDQNARVVQKIKQTDRVAENRMNSVYAMFQDTRNFKWLCSFFGTSVIPPGSNQMIHITDDTTSFYLPIELSDGSIILGNQNGGLFKYTPDGNNYAIHRIDSVDSAKEYFPIGQDKQGGIWVSEQMQKIIIVDQNTLLKIGEIPISGFVAGMIENDNRTAWVATSTGLYKVQTDEYKIIETFNAQNNLSCDGISNMLMDESGKLWLSCKNQIMVFDPLSEKTKIFNQYDGLPLTPFTTPVAYRFKTGEMWFSSPGSIVRFHPAQVKGVGIQAIPQITNLLINDHPSINGLQCERTGARNITAIEKLTFSHLENTLSFLVNSLEYSAPQSNMVKYILEGVDKEWLEIKSGGQVRYPNLRDGTFHFKVRAANSDGEYSNDIRELTITITPPFYRTWWFITFILLAGLGLILYIMYLIFSKKLELQKVRLRLYENLHDEVGSRLTSIVFMAEEVAQNNAHNP